MAKKPENMKDTAPAVETKDIATVQSGPTQEVATSGISAETLFADAEEQMGEFGKADLAIPFLRVLQSLSPQVKKSDAAYIQGAEEGDFLNTVTSQIWKGPVGVVIIPVHYARNYSEFKPRKMGGGFVKDHGSDSSIMEQTVKDDDGRNIIERTVNGNREIHEIVESGQYFNLILDEEAGTFQNSLLALGGSQWGKVRKWNTLIQTMQVQVNGRFVRPPMYYQSWKLTSVPEKNEKGAWMGLNIARYKTVNELKNGEYLYEMAKEFRKLIMEGAVKVVQEQPTGTAPNREEDDEPAF